MSRAFTIKELNEKIDSLIAEYKGTAEECYQELSEPERGGQYYAKVEALEELKLELNSPEPIVNVTEKIQESLNIIETNKIINDGL